MRAPASGCSRMSAHSSSSSGLGLEQQADAAARACPTSCTSAPSWMTAAESASAPSCSATSRAYSATVAECSAVSASKAASARTSATPVAREALSTARDALRLRQGVRRNLLTRCRSQAVGAAPRRVALDSPPPRLRRACVNPCETADGRCKHRPSPPCSTAAELPAVALCVHMTLLPVPGTASEAARETILGPSTRRLYRIRTQLRKQSEPAAEHSFRKPLWHVEPMRYVPQIAGNGARANGRAAIWAARPAKCASAQGPDPEVPQNQRAF